MGDAVADVGKLSHWRMLFTEARLPRTQNVILMNKRIQSVGYLF